jgi:hypothetical protein
VRWVLKGIAKDMGGLVEGIVARSSYSRRRRRINMPFPAKSDREVGHVPVSSVGDKLFGRIPDYCTIRKVPVRLL